MSIFIKPGFWDEKTIAPKYWFNLEKYIKFVISLTAPYKVYTALLTQVGTNPPTVNTVLENTIGSITFQYSGVGEYDIISPTLFTSNKTIGFFTTGRPQPNGIVFGTQYVNSSTIKLYTRNGSNTPVNDVINLSPIEIRVYS
jgi:hypothetical protein